MNHRIASAVLRLRTTLETLLDCSKGDRPAWWDGQLESGLHGTLRAVYEQGVGERDDAVLLTDAALGVVPPNGPVQWTPYETIVSWTPPTKEPPSTMLRLKTTSGDREVRLRDGDPLRFVVFLLWLSRADRGA